MVESAEAISLITALDEGADESRLASLLASGELARVFPALGLPTNAGLALLRAVSRAGPSRGSADPSDAFVTYLRRLRAIGPELDAILDDLRSHEPRILATAWERARELLPAHFRTPEVRLVFLPLGLDFRTDRETVYMDPVAAVSLGLDGIQTILAHELHHVGRYRLTGENLTLMSPDPLPGITNASEVFRNWSSWLEAEGVADCVSNMTQTDFPLLHAAVETRRQQMAGYAALLESAQQRIGAAAHSPPAALADLEQLRSDLLKLAHPVGARLAEAVLRRFGRPGLIECVGRPEKFLQRYNDVASAEHLLEIDGDLIQGLVEARAAEP